MILNQSVIEGFLGKVNLNSADRVSKFGVVIDDNEFESGRTLNLTMTFEGLVNDSFYQLDLKLGHIQQLKLPDLSPHWTSFCELFIEDESSSGMEGICYSLRDIEEGFLCYCQWMKFERLAINNAEVFRDSDS